MGTVQKIIESLNRISDDKKGQLTTRYVEHSSWMRSELDLIKSLIKKNPRDDHTANDENVPPIEIPSANTSSNRSSSEKNEEESAVRHKRKSPEMGLLGSSNSPDLKRNSTQEYDELATSAGLPTDLNRLKKEQLLEELESRGNVEFSMKSLKKDLVDALKEALLRCSKEGIDENSVQNQQQNIENVPTSFMSQNGFESVTEVVGDASEIIYDAEGVPAVTESVKKLRNGSLMAEFRSLINNPTQSVESESDRAVKIQNEYQARQKRHRQSQTGKLSLATEGIRSTDGDVIPSPLVYNSVVDLTADEQQPQSGKEMNIKNASITDTAHPEVMDLVFSPSKPSADPSQKVKPTLELEVQGPCPCPPSPGTILKMDLGPKIPVQTKGASSTEPDRAHTVSLSSAEGAQALGLLAEGVPVRDRERDSMSSTSTYSTISSSLSLAFNSASGSNLTPAQLSGMQMNNHSVSAVSSMIGSQANMIKKPTNLVGGQSTFIEKNVVEKAVAKIVAVPALEKARQAKLADEAKAIQKKKDLEKKIATLNANSTANTAKLNNAGPVRSGQTANSAANSGTTASRFNLPSTTVGPRVNALNKSQTLGQNSGVGSGSTSKAAQNPFAATSNSSMKPKDTPTYTELPEAESSLDSKELFSFLSTKKTPDTAVLLSVPTSTPIGASDPTSTPAIAQTPVEAITESVQEAAAPKGTRRRTMQGQNQDPSIPTIPPSLPLGDDEASVASSSSYTTAPLPPQPLSATAGGGEKRENEGVSPPPPYPALSVEVPSPPRTELPPQVPVSVPVPIVREPLRTPPKQLSPASKIPFQVSPPRPQALSQSISSVTPMNAPKEASQQNAASKKEVAIIEEDEEEGEEEEEVEEKQYAIKDKGGDSDGEGDDSGTDEDEDEETEQEKQKRMPEWARGAMLKEALEKQYGLNGHTPMDPDSIFYEVQTCSLEEIFGTKEGRCGAYAKRTSSAAWDHDSLSLIEKRTYRSQMGYGGIAASGGKR